MDVNGLILGLREELTLVNSAIGSLEKLQRLQQGKSANPVGRPRLNEQQKRDAADARLKKRQQQQPVPPQA